MSRSRESRKSRVSASASVPPLERNVRLQGGLFPRPVLLQLAAIVGLSCVLGFTFNAANPVGVRFDQPAGEPSPAFVAAVKTPIPDAHVRSNLVPVPPLPPVPANMVAGAPPSTPRPALPLPQVPVLPSDPVTNPVAAFPTPALPAVPANPAPIHWPEAKTLVAEGSGVFVDVRHNAMFQAGHIPGAISLPEHSPPEVFTAFLNEQPTNRTLIVYCSSTSCSQSARVANRFVHEFHRTSVRYMTGGYLEYQQAELAKPTPAPVP